MPSKNPQLTKTKKRGGGELCKLNHQVKLRAVFNYQVTDAVATFSPDLSIIIPTLRDFCHCDYSLADR